MSTTVTVDVEDEAIVVDETRGALHLLNSTGALVWRCLDGVSSLDEICADIAEVLGMPLATVEADVDLLAQRLLDEGVAATPGDARPLQPEEVADEPECGHDHSVDGDQREPFALAPNP